MNYRMRFLVSCILCLLLNSCYTIKEVKIASLPYKVSEKKFTRYTNLNAEVISKPSCDDPITTFYITAHKNYDYTAYYEKYGVRGKSRFYRISQGILGFGSLLSVGVGLFMTRETASSNSRATGGKFLGAGAVVFTSLLVSGSKANKKLRKRVPLGSFTKELYTYQKVYFENSRFNVKINGITKTFTTNSNGQLKVNMIRDFNLRRNHDYLNSPIQYTVSDYTMTDSGLIKDYFDRKKIVNCIYRSVIVKYIDSSNRVAARKAVEELLNDDNCYSKAEFQLAVLAQLAIFIGEDNDNTGIDLALISLCYLIN